MQLSPLGAEDALTEFTTTLEDSRQGDFTSPLRGNVSEVYRSFPGRSSLYVHDSTYYTGQVEVKPTELHQG